MQVDGFARSRVLCQQTQKSFSSTTGEMFRRTPPVRCTGGVRLLAIQGMLPVVVAAAVVVGTVVTGMLAVVVGTTVERIVVCCAVVAANIVEAGLCLQTKYLVSFHFLRSAFLGGNHSYFRRFILMISFHCADSCKWS